MRQLDVFHDGFLGIPLGFYKERPILAAILPKNTARWRQQPQNHKIHKNTKFSKITKYAKYTKITKITKFTKKPKITKFTKNHRNS